LLYRNYKLASDKQTAATMRFFMPGLSASIAIESYPGKITGKKKALDFTLRL
jgi:hypothetical protein